ncbi:hypothetical protein [Falsiroseomonas sp. E2-1-a4]|uniref:hypothetical protein n=1 Tax=Falsiroseomonas sp. E2-1-a4 TaxID=3239299 RepID=UPI003F3646A8
MSTKPSPLLTTGTAARPEAAAGQSHTASPALHLQKASDAEARRAALLRLAAALGRAEARRLARPGRGAAVGPGFLLTLLIVATLLAAALLGAGR